MRTLLALAAGVRRTAYWDLGPEVPDWADPLKMMHVLIGKLPLLDYRNGTLAVRHPAAEAFAMLADQLDGVRSVIRVEVDHQPGLYAFEVDLGGPFPLLVGWDHRDPFDGEDEPPVEFSWPWTAPSAAAADVFGRACPVEVREGRVHLAVSLTPVFVRPVRQA